MALASSKPPALIECAGEGMKTGPVEKVRIVAARCHILWHRIRKSTPRSIRGPSPKSGEVSMNATRDVSDVYRWSIQTITVQLNSGTAAAWNPTYHFSNETSYNL